MQIKSMNFYLFAAFSLLLLSSCGGMRPFSPKGAVDSRGGLTVVKSAAEAIDKSGWWILVCTAHTESNSLQISIGKDANDYEDVAWNQTSGAEINVPQKYRNTVPLWVRGRVFDLKRANYCVIQKDTSRKVFDLFREQEENIAGSDVNACPCAFAP